MKRTAIMTIAVLGLFMTACAPRNPFLPGLEPYGGPDEARVPYGTQDREDVTGAVSAVPMDQNAHLTDVLSLLRNNVPGLQVTELANGEVRLRIRGDQQTMRTDDASNQPLLVVDDMPVLPSAVGIVLRGMQPQQVASIHVLKDVSSTAIYGSRGANGVILIHMKR